MNLAKTYLAATVLVSCICGLTQAEIQSFTPSGISTVAQNEGLFWDIFSDQTALADMFQIELELTDHGDIHFDATITDFINDPAFGGTTGLNLLPGTIIGPDSDFGGNSFFVGTTDFGGGTEFGVPTIYGFSFLIEDDTHFGWVSFQEELDAQTLLGWAYEDQPFTSIAAGAVGVPEPNALLMLFVPSVFLTLRRAR